MTKSLLYDRIIITIVPSYTGKHKFFLPSVLLVRVCSTCNNANKQQLCAVVKINVIGASLSTPHTSMTAFAEVVCMYVCLLVAIYRKF